MGTGNLTIYNDSDIQAFFVVKFGLIVKDKHWLDPNSHLDFDVDNVFYDVSAYDHESTSGASLKTMNDVYGGNWAIKFVGNNGNYDFKNIKPGDPT